MKETTITAQELENIVGNDKEEKEKREILSRRLLAHQIHEYEGGEMPKADKLEQHPKIDITWTNLTDEDFKRIAMAKAQGFEEEFLSWVK